MTMSPLKRVLHSPVLPCIALPLDAYLGAHYLADGRTVLGTITTAIAVFLALHLILRGDRHRRQRSAPTVKA